MAGQWLNTWTLCPPSSWSKMMLLQEHQKTLGFGKSALILQVQRLCGRNLKPDF
jgi:hypothetical protein